MYCVTAHCFWAMELRGLLPVTGAGSLNVSRVHMISLQRLRLLVFVSCSYGKVCNM